MQKKNIKEACEMVKKSLINLQSSLRGEDRTALKMHWLGKPPNTKSMNPREPGNIMDHKQNLTKEKFTAKHTQWPLCPWNSPGENTGVGVHLHMSG